MPLPPRLDKTSLQRLNRIEPSIDADVLADTLCDGELLALVLDRWAIAEFQDIGGIVLNKTIRDDEKLIIKIPSMLAELDHFQVEEQFNKYFDFEILNDPACPRDVLAYVLQALAYLWEAQAKQQLPDRKLRFQVGYSPEEGVDGASYIQIVSVPKP